MSETRELSMVPGALYRNSVGGELWAVARVDSKMAKRMVDAIDPVHAAIRGCNPFALSVMVLGEIWVVQTRDKLSGIQLHLATPEGLVECGYELVSQSEGGDDA